MAASSLACPRRAAGGRPSCGEVAVGGPRQRVGGAPASSRPGGVAASHGGRSGCAGQATAVVHPGRPTLPYKITGADASKRARPGLAGARRRYRPGRDGHQILGPMSSTSAGTSTERTTSASSSTPKAITKPISVRNTSGSTASTEKVPGEHDAGRGDDGAGDGEAAQHAVAGAVALGLLADPRHQEDVVVDPQAHEEDEGEQRQRRVDAGEAEHDVEHDEAEAERGGEGRSRWRSAAAARRARAAARSGSAAPRAGRSGDHDGVARRRPRTSYSIAVGPPTSTSGPPASLTAARRSGIRS